MKNITVVQKTWPVIGIIQAVLLVIMTAFHMIFMRLANEVYHVDALIFTGISILTAAFVMTIGAGPGRLGKETILSPATWFYATLLIITYVADMMLMDYITATEGALLFNISVPYALLFAYLWMNRKPDSGDKIGLIFIIISVAIILVIQPPHLLLTVIVLSLMGTVADTTRLFIAETHRESNIANEHGNLRDKARVMGFVTFTASLAYLGLLALFSIITHEGYLGSWFIAHIPHPSLFSDPASIFAGMIFGVSVTAPIRYLLWVSAYNLKSESVTSIMAFLPALTLGMEWLISNIFSFNFNSQILEGQNGFYILLSTFCVSLGAFFQIKSKSTVDQAPMADIKKQLLRGEDRALATGYQPTARDDFEAVSATIEQCGGDSNLAARLLDVPHGALQCVWDARGQQAFHPTVAARVARNFRQNVALADPLTGLQNRLSFMNALRQILQSKKPLALLFIDLNKFKPVNDTYGHDAGDAVLKTIGQRLQQVAPPLSLVARLGGDEFVVTLQGRFIHQAEAVVKDLLASMREPILLTSDLPPVEVDAAVGTAFFPKNATSAEDLIKYADKAMYKNKGQP